MSTITMEELELETAELLPSRETLCAPRCCYPCHPFVSISVCISVNVGCL